MGVQHGNGRALLSVKLPLEFRCALPLISFSGGIKTNKHKTQCLVHRGAQGDLLAVMGDQVPSHTVHRETHIYARGHCAAQRVRTPHLCSEGCRFKSPGWQSDFSAGSLNKTHNLRLVADTCFLNCTVSWIKVLAK